MEKRYRVYVLQNTTGKFYIGLSEDVGYRLNQHYDGGFIVDVKVSALAVSMAK